MRALFSCILAGLLALALAADALARETAKDPGWGRVYTVRGKVTVRENPSEGALTVRVLKGGQKVRVDFEDAGWAAVFDPAESVRAETRAQGYVRLPELRSEARPEAKAEPGLRAEVSGRVVKSTKPDKSDTSTRSDKGVKKPPQKATQGQDFGELRVADRKMAIRAGRDKDTEFMRLLQAGQRVRVDFQEDGWFAVFAPDEKVRDLKRAWGYGRDKFLVPEKDYAGQPLPEPKEAAPKESAAKESSSKEPSSKEPSARESQAKSLLKQKGDDVVAYSVLGRQADNLRPLAPVVLRVRLDAAAPPAPEALRKIVREIWKAERRKNEDLQVEVLLPGMDQGGLAFGVARFHEDGRLKEFWWREVVLRTRH